MQDDDNPDLKPDLVFEKSTSTTVGIGGRVANFLREKKTEIHDKTLDLMVDGTLLAKKHGDKIFGATNATGDALLIGLTALNPDHSTAELVGASLYFLGNVPMWMSGDEKGSSIIEAPTETPQQSWVEKMGKKAAKPFNPKKYPVECYAALTCAGAATFASIGMQDMAHEMTTGAATTVGFGALGMTSTLMQIFAPSKAEIAANKAAKEAEQLTFKDSTYEVVNKENMITRAAGWVKENPEKLSGKIGVGASATMLASGIANGNLGLGVAGGLYVAAYSFYQKFVRREKEINPDLPNSKNPIPNVINPIVDEKRPEVGSHTAALAAQSGRDLGNNLNQKTV